MCVNIAIFWSPDGGTVGLEKLEAIISEIKQTNSERYRGDWQFYLFVCANTDEETFKNFDANPKAKHLAEYAAQHGLEVVPVCAKLEDELGQLEPEDAAMFMEEIGIRETGLNRVIKTGYRLLDYITFFTAGPMESRAWTVTRGTPAPQAAGKIHTDLCRGFIRMETVSYEDLVAAGGWTKAQAAGKLRIEGKDYLIQDGDVIHVRFSV